MYPMVRLQVRLTFGQTSDQVDIWSDFSAGWHLVRCTLQEEDLGKVDILPDAPPTPEGKGEDQVDILSDGLLAGQLQVAHWQTGQLPKCQPDPSKMSLLKVETSGQGRLTSFGEIRYRVRLTFGQT